MIPAALSSEGTGLPPLIDLAGDRQSWERKSGGTSGNCIDTDDNASDYVRNHHRPGEPAVERQPGHTVLDSDATCSS